MPSMIVALLMILWLLSVVSSYKLGKFVDPLLVYLWFSSFIDHRHRPAL